MTNLRKPVNDKIDELGLDKAAEYFGKSKATINLWRKTGNIPISAAEQVMSDNPSETTSTELERVAGGTEIAEQMHENEHTQIWVKLNELRAKSEETSQRIEKMENFISNTYVPKELRETSMHSTVVQPNEPRPQIAQQNAPPPTPTVQMPTEMARGENLIKPGQWLRPHQFVQPRNI